MMGPTMNLISGTHHSCERREYAFIVFREYTIISPEGEGVSLDPRNTLITVGAWKLELFGLAPNKQTVIFFIRSGALFHGFNLCTSHFNFVSKHLILSILCFKFLFLKENFQK